MKTEFTKTFPSGLRIVFKKMTGIYSVSLGVMVRAGSRYETVETNGFSHFVEHLLFKGTQKRTALRISEEIDEIGGQMNAYTSKDVTCYYTRTASEYTEKCFDLLSDMLFNSTYDEENLELERKVILEEMSMDEDLPDELCHDLIAESIFGSNPLGRTIVGTADVIKHCDRHSIIDFKEKFYIPQNIVISIAGNADFEQLCDMTEKYFEQEFIKRKISGAQMKLITPKYLCGYTVKFKDVEQSHVELAYPSVQTGDELMPAINVMTNIFGGGMSSRLFQSVRERNGLAYTVYGYSSSYADSGYFEIYCGTNPENIAKLMPLLDEEVKNIYVNGVTDAELSKGIAQSIGNNILSQESSMTIMNAYGGYMIRKDQLLDIEEKINATRKVTKEDVLKAVHYIFESKPALAYVGKKIDEQPLKKLQ